MANLFNDDFGSTEPRNLFFDTTHPKDVKSVTLKAGQGILEWGTVVGVITATGLAVPVNSTATDGSELADSILTDSIDTGTGGAAQNTVTTAYSSGSFNRQALKFGGADTAEKHETRLRSLGIFMKDVQEY
ncbi:head decoration protein [Paenibacillus sp. FJAT-26967]|uniref:head decoration protein n=1 Tax=Paenibacillus sp. FJAT-26967 TaxID=1729690 RepID=UPI000837E6C7|nr:head decoration protein [Paenibacillus sp. FJAT-26967]